MANEAWNIFLYKKDTNPNGQFTPSSDYYESIFQSFTENTNSGWAYGNQQAYKDFEYKRFVTQLQNGEDINLRDYALLVQSVNPLPPKMMLQVGNRYMESDNNQYKTSDNKVGHFFDLSTVALSEIDGELIALDVGNHLLSGDDNIGVRTFTLQPMWTDNAMGQESIVVSFSPDYYTPTLNIFSTGQADKDFYRVFTSDTGNLKAKTTLDSFEIEIGETEYEVHVGAIADYMLHKNTSLPLNIVINGRNNSYIDGNQVLLSQNIIYREKSSTDENDWRMFTLGWDKPIVVNGRRQDNQNFMGHGALVTGAYIENDRSENEFQQFYGGLLDVYSTYETSDANEFSVEISGVSFTDAPKRGMGSVTANGYFGAIETNKWINSSPSGTDATWLANLKKAMQEAMQPNNFYNLNSGTRNTRVKLWDNQMITWNTKSDGFESLSPNLFSGKNFIKTNDDAIKMLSRSQKFQENTIHLGPDGAGMSFGYGFNNGPVKDLKIDGAYFHRVIQPGNGSDEDYSGLISDWMYWNKNLVSESEGIAGIMSPTFNDVYIPSMKNDNGYDANQLARIGNVTAVVNTDRNYFRTKYPTTLNDWYIDNQKYEAGGYTLSNWNNNLPAAKWFIANADYGGDNNFNMNANSFQKADTPQVSSPQTWTLVMNKQNQNDKPGEELVKQKINYSPFNPFPPPQTQTEESNKTVIYNQGVSYFDLQDYGTTTLKLSDTLKTVGRNFEFKNGNQVVQALKIDASDLDQVRLKIGTSTNKNNIINSGPLATGYEINGIYLDSGAGDDQITGTSFNDFIRGGIGDDIINAGDGDDICRLGRGNDVIDLGDGADILFLTIDQLGQTDLNKIINFDFNEDRILIHSDLKNMIYIDYKESSFSIGFIDADPGDVTTFHFDKIIENINIGFDH